LALAFLCRVVSCWDTYYNAGGIVLATIFETYGIASNGCYERHHGVARMLFELSAGATCGLGGGQRAAPSSFISNEAIGNIWLPPPDRL